MKLKTRLLALLMIWALLLGCLTGCQRAPEEKPASGPASQPEADEDDYPPEEGIVDVYGDYVLSDAVEPGKYPPPTDEVVAEADAWLTAQEGIVQDFREKNKAVLENAAGKLFAISGQYPDRKYYYEIADRNLVTSLVLTEDDPEEAALREELTEALNQVSGLPGADAFERVLINDWSLNSPIFELSGAIKVFDGIGCCVSLVCLPDGAPEKTPDTLKMLDAHWALLTFRKNRDEMGMTVPSDKCAEVYRVQMAKQAREEYRFLLENKALMEQIAAEMAALAMQDPTYYFTYDFEDQKLDIHSWSGFPYEGPGASDALIARLDKLSSAPDIETVEYIYAYYQADDPDVDYDEEMFRCAFGGRTLYFDGSGYWYDLNYTPDEAPEKLPYSECIKLDEHWYLSSEHIPG